jgi:hypothetical protein
MAEVIRRTLKKLTGANLIGPERVKIGFPKGGASQFVINKAVWNEFGTRGGASGGGWGGPIPERPFMRNAWRNGAPVFKADMISRARELMAGVGTLGSALQRLGEKGRDDIRGSITALQDPPNAPATIERKGFNNPLVMTGEMRADVTFKVSNG